MRGALLLTVLFLTAALSGCTGDSDDFDDHMGDDGHMDDGHHHTSSEGNTEYTGQEDVLVTVIAGDPEEFRFVPENITVLAGQSVGVTFRNEGDIEHEFSIGEFEFHLHAGAGGEVQGSFVADREGTFTIGCYIPGHFEAGMKGTLTVDPAEA